jgi:hypothetical protein
MAQRQQKERWRHARNCDSYQSKGLSLGLTWQGSGKHKMINELNLIFNAAKTDENNLQHMTS